MSRRDDDDDGRRTGALGGDDARLLLESVSDYAIFMLDPEGVVRSWNEGARRIKGYEAAEIIGRHFSVFYGPEDVESGRPVEVLRAARAEGRAEDEGFRLRKDGTRFWASVVVTALFNDDGSLRGFGKITRDLTHRRMIEEQLRASEERFHHLVDAVTDYAIFMLDTEGRVATWNSGAERTKQYNAREIIGQSMAVFYTPDDRQDGRPERVLATVRRDGRFEDEGFRVRKDGSWFWANVIITSLRDSRGALAGFVKVTRDLTARRQAEITERDLVRAQAAQEAAEASERRLRESEQRAIDAARRADEANRMKDEFLATVSHELRTPLNSIMGWSFILRERNTDPACTPAVEAIHRNVQAQARIIDDILDVSRIVTGKLSLDLRPTSMVAIVHDALEVVRPSASAKRIALVFTPGDDVSLVADPERMRQVVWNLLSNAVKFTPTGGRVEIALTSDGESATLEVRDTGHGIDAAVLPHVFERFTQADSSSTRRFGGLGLGLAIVRHIVELHGGSVHAESYGAGTGATFRAVLPLRASSTEVARVPAVMEDVRDDAPVPTYDLGGVRVLVVDDDEETRRLVEGVLVAHEAIVDGAGSSREAMASLERRAPDVVVSDVAMPGEDGHALMRRIRARGPAYGGEVPSIALTAFAGREDRARALEAGFTTYLPKPVSPRELVAAVARLVHR